MKGKWSSLGLGERGDCKGVTGLAFPAFTEEGTGSEESFRKVSRQYVSSISSTEILQHHAPQIGIKGKCALEGSSKMS